MSDLTPLPLDNNNKEAQHLLLLLKNKEVVALSWEDAENQLKEVEDIALEYTNKQLMEIHVAMEGNKKKITELTASNRKNNDKAVQLHINQLEEELDGNHKKLKEIIVVREFGEKMKLSSGERYCSEALEITDSKSRLEEAMKSYSSDGPLVYPSSKLLAQVTMERMGISSIQVVGEPSFFQQPAIAIDDDIIQEPTRLSLVQKRLRDKLEERKKPRPEPVDPDAHLYTPEELKMLNFIRGGGKKSGDAENEEAKKKKAAEVASTQPPMTEGELDKLMAEFGLDEEKGKKKSKKAASDVGGGGGASKKKGKGKANK
jgi:hypothetical protein